MPEGMSLSVTVHLPAHWSDERVRDYAKHLPDLVAAPEIIVGPVAAAGPCDESDWRDRPAVAYSLTLALALTVALLAFAAGVHCPKGGPSAFRSPATVEARP